MTQCRSIAGIFVFLLMTSTVAQADFVFNGWNDGALSNWVGATGVAVLEVVPSGGYNGGYLQSTESVPQYGIVGAINYGPEYTGDFVCHGYVRVQVAVKFLAGSFLTSYFHVRYLDASHNGWQIQLGADFDNPDWQMFAFDFDPTWTDVEAEAAGWSRDFASATFVETMANVYSTGVKATGTGSLSMGLDHFSLWDQVTSATTSTWSEIKTLYR